MKYILTILATLLLIGCDISDTPQPKEKITVTSENYEQFKNYGWNDKCDLSKIPWTCGIWRSIELFAGKDTPVGEIQLAESVLIDTPMGSGQVSLEIIPYQGYEFDVVHLWIGTNIEDAPLNKQGVPVIGHFPYVDDQAPFVFDLPYQYPAVIIVHAEVSGNGLQGETAFAGDQQGWSKRWWYYDTLSIGCWRWIACP